MSGATFAVAPARQAGRRVRLTWLVGGVIAAMAAALFIGSIVAGHRLIGADAHAYWLTGHRAHLYSARPMARDAYLYPPIFAQVIRPLTLLPWPAFFALWVVAESLAFVWLLRPLGWQRAVPVLVLLCGFEIVRGNIIGFIAVAAVIGMRRPTAWAFPTLTKVTTGLGPLWFAVRGEWRSVLRCLAMVMVVVGASVAIDPTAWREWIHFSLTSHSDALFPVRLCGAAVLTVVAARRNQPWLLAPALFLASPVMQGVVPQLSVLAAVPRLRRQEQA
jgi:hypothetical protein